MTNGQDASEVAAYNIADAQRENEVLRAENKRLRATLVKAREFVDMHSEPWYGSGQALLTEITEALK
jgi:hypothetical protein